MVRNQLPRLIFILLFCLILIYPLVGVNFDDTIALSGVTATEELGAFNIEGIMDGSYQSSLNSWIENNFPGRNLLIKLRSQLRYTLLSESPNSNVLVGKDKQLFEYNYIDQELGIARMEESYFPETIAKLEQLQAILNEQGKELYIFITPNKAYFYKDSIPDYYSVLAEDRKTNYQLFMECLEDSELYYFDSRTFMENYDGLEVKAPFFYSTGIHWSTSWGLNAAKAFSEYISENSKWKLSTLVLNESACDEPYWPDADLYQSLNLMAEPSDIQFYHASLSIVEEGDRPNVFYRGGSFMGASINGLIYAGVFDKNVHFENNYYFTDNFTSQEVLGSYTAYDEIAQLPDLLGETDILVLEVNEANIGGIAFNFIDYLLEHPDFLAYPER